MHIPIAFINSSPRFTTRVNSYSKQIPDLSRMAPDQSCTEVKFSKTEVGNEYFSTEVGIQKMSLSRKSEIHQIVASTTATTPTIL
uniref:Uncharacterized protein n=1 Tax=Caenorhabditis japonica TaxID=281687 RepID=A0A8R1I9Z3_CAEJA